MLWISCIALVALAAVYTLRPLFSESEGILDHGLPAETEADRLLDSKIVIYRNLRDLELEYKMGRLSETDFRQLEMGYKSEAAAVLQRLDQLKTFENVREAAPKHAGKQQAKSPGAGRKPGQEAKRCPSCGAESPAGKKYCADCGHHL